MLRWLSWYLRLGDPYAADKRAAQLTEDRALSLAKEASTGVSDAISLHFAALRMLQWLTWYLGLGDPFAAEKKAARLTEIRGRQRSEMRREMRSDPGRNDGVQTWVSLEPERRRRCSVTRGLKTCR